MRIPFGGPWKFAMRTGGWIWVLGSAGSNPAITEYIRATSSAVAAIGPRWPTLGQSGTAPNSLTLPNVGISPTAPQNAAGIRIEPPPSAPIAAGQSPAATAAARVRGMQVVIAGSKCRQRHAEKKDCIRPLFRLCQKRGARLGPDDNKQSPDAHEQERQVGRNVQKIGDAEVDALVGEVVIAGVLQYRRFGEVYSRHGKHGCGQE